MFKAIVSRISSAVRAIATSTRRMSWLAPATIIVLLMLF